MSNTAIQNFSFAEVNVMNISAKFQLYPLMASEEMIFEYFFSNLAFRLPWQPIKFRGYVKNDMFGEDSRNIFVKCLSGYLQ